MYLKKHILTAEIIIKYYDGSRPFNTYLKGFFYENKKFGSRDRKSIQNICYSVFRLGLAGMPLPFIDQVNIAFFLMNHPINVWGEDFPELWVKNVNLPIEDKFKLISQIIPDFKVENIAPFSSFFSEQIHIFKFWYSLFTQPFVFVRIRPNYEEIVFYKLNSSQIYFKQIDKNCLAFDNNISLEKIFNINQEVVIQDYNSQNIKKLFDFIEFLNLQPISMLDVCAGGGGKTILFKDSFPFSTISVNDIRLKKLRSLKKRFLEAGIEVENFYNIDFASSNIKDKFYDIIIIDAPCTSSGTWVRNPEKIRQYKISDAEYYNQLQKNICFNAVQNLKNKGYLVYITCSLFKLENESIVNFIESSLNLNCLKSMYFFGYESNAETLFGAVFHKNY